jgi:hypothetical protein
MWWKYSKIAKPTAGSRDCFLRFPVSSHVDRTTHFPAWALNICVDKVTKPGGYCACESSLITQNGAITLHRFASR